MKQKNGTEGTPKVPQDVSETPTRKGLHRYFHVSKLDWYLSVVIAIIFTIFGVIELFGIAKLTFIRMGNSFQFALLFAIFGMVSRIYYKMFEEQYEKRK
jgi:energy-coupling factor transporter transmembrane protein EcfT